VTPLRVFLGGEGACELGSRAGDAAYHSDDRPGVLDTLLRRVQPEGWSIVGARKWSKIRKYRAGDRASAEERNVRGLVLDAVEAKANVLAFSRDADDDTSRAPRVHAGIAWTKSKYPQLGIVGEMAIPTLEGWVLAMRGVAKTEQLRKAQAETRLAEEGISRKSTEGMVQVARDCDLETLPEDALSLRSWLGAARESLSPKA
jgi:hypothetical protein